MINQETLLVAASLAILVFVTPRKYFLVSYILAACFVPMDQRIIIADLDFTVLRILIVVGVLRLWLRGEVQSIKWNRFDKMVLLWAVVGSVIYVIQWADKAALIYKCGRLYELLGLYWLFRQTVRSWGDIKFLLKVFAICSLLLAILVGFEWATGRNPFVVLGRVQTIVREGRYRCQAAFPHSIMLGLFWATLVPLFIGLAMVGKNKLLYWGATAAGIFLVIASASSGPIMTLIIVLIVLSGFKGRHYIRFVTFVFFASAIALHIIMQGPVWSLIAKVNIISGSSGWHRYYLIDQAIRHFREWALIGVRSTAHWGWGLEDVTNQYVLEGVRGGAVTLGLFISMLVMCFVILAKHFTKSIVPEQELPVWCLFAAMVGHCVAFTSVSYFGQIMMLWYLMLAITGFLTEKLRQENMAFKSFLELAT